MLLSLVEWLLGLERLRLERDAPLLLRWNTEAPAWLLFGCGLIAAGCVAGFYRKEPAPRGAKLLLGPVRFSLFALVAAVLCQPSLVLQRNRVERSQVALLVDASASMAVMDRYLDADLAGEVARGAGLPAPEDAARHDRLSLVRGALLRDDGAALKRLLAVNGVQLLTFDSRLSPCAFAADAEALPSLVEALSGVAPTGTATHLAAALGGAIEAARGRRLAAIVLVSDGRSTQPGDIKPAIDMAADRRIPILPVRFGSPARTLDVELGPILTQETAFVGDVVAIDASVLARGVEEPTTILVDLFDAGSGDRLATEEAAVGADGAGSVELRVSPVKSGELRIRVAARPLPGESNTDNNSDTATVLVQDRRARVLYVEGYPRFEYRYLKNALARERTVELSVLLLDADEGFVQEGADPIRRFPESSEELGRYDVVLFGDVDPRGGWLSATQEQLLIDFVRERGGGFAVIAGERATPSRWRGAELEKLLPVRIDPTFLGKYAGPLVHGFAPRLTPDGASHRLFRFSLDRGQSRALFEALPALHWSARTLGPKPGARVLLEVPLARDGEAAQPLVVASRYGAGRVFYQGTDDTWQWRRHTGELLHDGYWVRVVRELLPEGGAGGDPRVALRTDHRSYSFGDAVHAELEVRDVELLSSLHEAVEFKLVESPGDGGRDAASESHAADSTTSTPVSGALLASVPATRLDETSNRFEAAIVPPKSGAYRIEASGVPLQPGQRPLSVGIRVEPPDLELRRPEADHDSLERIAAATGGSVIALDRLEEGFAAIRDRSVQSPDDLTEPLWDSPLVLLAFVLLVTSEWIVRKVFGLT